MHLSENGYFKHKGLSSFIDFAEFFIFLQTPNNAAGATNMSSFEMNGFMSWLIPKMPFGVIIKDWLNYLFKIRTDMF